MAAMHELTPTLGAVAACRALGLPRGIPARAQAQARRAAWVGPPLPPAAPRPRPPLALDPVESQMLLDTLNSERFADTAPAAVHATLLDEGRYLGSVRTMYRLLAANGGVHERRNQLTHPAYVKPELLALKPNQVWSWDISQLKGQQLGFDVGRMGELVAPLAHTAVGRQQPVHGAHRAEVAALDEPRGVHGRRRGVGEALAVEGVEQHLTLHWVQGQLGTGPWSSRALFKRLCRLSRPRVSWAMCSVSARCGSTLGPRFCGARAADRRRRVGATRCSGTTSTRPRGASVHRSPRAWCSGRRPRECGACRHWRAVGAGRGQRPRRLRGGA